MPKKKPDVSSAKTPMRPQEGEVVCVVKKLLGGEHLNLLCVDGNSYVGRIPGRLKKRVWINEGDVVLAAPWDFQAKKCDVLHKYGHDELRKLEEEGVIDKDLIEKLRE